ncbi:cysteine--tRNA ligase [Microvirga terrestris]|uniref:Cysteine--tRNA ligase n=1 Tax=Microvirga terrestris TaxID=2791024 RepID=A0ABS0HU42_9HYPH|nr:cysteine--tRNA ligase [Microvirga terrestris]MBF9196884.1 cysteine--tRNA ligase [Microvirga terrestris]
MAAKLRLYNTLTRSKDDFVPIDPANVRLYVCGPTVYDYAHIGNARPIIVFDLLFRLLRHVYGKEAVTYVRNITDVDDKINARAARDYPGMPHNEAIRAVTGKTEEQFHADIRALGVLMPEDVNEAGQPPRFVEPRATEHIDEMRMIIERLIARGAAYVAEEHVLFSVADMQNLTGVPKYGAFSKRSLDELLSGARVDVAPYKRDAMDFVLWKPSGPRDPAWASPAGIATPGRPGWHIECSAMAWRHLVQAFETRLTCADPTAREIFDIHGGGIDLVFPHHENEIAQSCCAFDTPRMANVWMHNGFLQVEGEKMSKSLGNFFTINELLQDWPGEVLRFNMLRTHYRQPIDWTTKGLEESQRVLERWRAVIKDIGVVETTVPRELIESLADDLNTPKALALMHRYENAARGARYYRGSEEHAEQNELGADAAGQLLASAMFFGIDLTTDKKQLLSAEFTQQVEALIAARKEARASKNWPESDRIRDELAALNVVVKDNKDGTTTWEVAR